MVVAFASDGDSQPNVGFSGEMVEIDLEAIVESEETILSRFSKEPAVAFAFLVRLVFGEGEILFHPAKVPLASGDVLYLRQRSVPDANRDLPETGVVVQVIGVGTANFQAAEEKTLFRLMTSVRSDELGRSFHEPSESLDEFMEARVRVRASIENGVWSRAIAATVTRNVDIFMIDPEILLRETTRRVHGLDLDLGKYKDESVRVFGGGFEKVNLITGMKGAGKSHLAKGLIDQNRGCGVSAIVFDINENDSYDQLPSAMSLQPGDNLKFRLDRMHPEAFLNLMMKLAPPGEATRPLAYAKIPKVIRDRTAEQLVPDIAYLLKQANNIVPGSDRAEQNMRASLIRSFEVIQSLDLIMTEAEARTENTWLKAESHGPLPNVISLSAAMAATIENGPSVLVTKLGGLTSDVQRVVVRLIIEHVKELCRRQTALQDENPRHVPIYPSIFFEEAHMYMDESDIDALVPIIRHVGPNLFFITNTPDALPDSVIRLIDNLVLTRLINSKDVTRVQACGLTDSETLSRFAGDLPEYHALLLSGLEGCTRGFPLVFEVRDFGLPASGKSRSIWRILERNAANEASN